MKKLFNSKYPIVCSPMNGVSDLNLALACRKAGIVPSFVPYTYPNFKDFFVDLAKYKTTQGDVIVALRLAEVIDTRLTDKLVSSGITHIELLEYDELDITEENFNILKKVRSQGIKIILKILSHTDINPYKNIIDAVTIKGPEAAGRSDNIDLIEEVNNICKNYPDIKIIVSGGIKNKNDIEKYISAGAHAVGIGTLFAMSKESSMPQEVKEKLLKVTSDDIKRLKSGARQRAIIFEEQGNDDFNNTNGLMSGLKTGSSGHVFVGNAINNINDIISVQEIVDHLLS